MNGAKTDIFGILASALQYPSPGLLAKLQAGLQTVHQKPTLKGFKIFVESIQGLSLGEWEELYTRTLDLNPAVAPYIGYQLWGDGYPRGNFMAALNRAYRAAGLEVEAELPDHLGAVLAYLETGSLPPNELIEAFEPAMQKMLARLQKSAPENPYLYLLEAVAQTVDLKTPQPV